MAVIAVDIPIQPGLSPLVGNDLPVPIVAELKRKAFTLSVRAANISLMAPPILILEFYAHHIDSQLILWGRILLHLHR